MGYIGYLSHTKTKWVILGTYHPPSPNRLYWVLITHQDKMAYIGYLSPPPTPPPPRQEWLILGRYHPPRQNGLYWVAITQPVEMSFIGYLSPTKSKWLILGTYHPTKSKWLILVTYHPPRQNGLYWVAVTHQLKMAYIEYLSITKTKEVRKMHHLL